MRPIKRILMATDFSAGAAVAATTAGQLARQLGATIDVVTAVDTSPLVECYGDVAFRTTRMAEIIRAARAQVEEFARQQFGDIDYRVHVRDGSVFLEIIRAAQDLGSDLIVMGTHGRTGLEHLLIGSTAEKVVRRSPIPVLTVRAGG